MPIEDKLYYVFNTSDKLSFQTTITKHWQVFEYLFLCAKH